MFEKTNIFDNVMATYMINWLNEYLHKKSYDRTESRNQSIKEYFVHGHLEMALNISVS